VTEAAVRDGDPADQDRRRSGGRRFRRILARATGGVAVVAAALVVCGFASGSWWQLALAAALYLIGFGLLRSRSARRDPDLVPGHLAWRRRLRWLLVGAGVASVVLATWLATEMVHPNDPIFLSTQAVCGSAVMPRRFDGVPAAATTAGTGQTVSADIARVFASSDCGRAIADQRAFALLFAQFGLLAIWAGLLRPLVEAPLERAGDTPTVEHDLEVLPDLVPTPPAPPTERPATTQTHLVAQPGRVVAIGLAVLVLAGAANAWDSHHDVTLALETDRQASAWIATYPPRIGAVTETLVKMVPAMQGHDFASLDQQCRSADAQVDSLQGAAAALPSGFEPLVADDLRAFVRDLHTAFGACISGSDRHDWPFIKSQMGRAVRAAGADAGRIARLAPQYR
jgi:hypothetical protein